MKGAGAGPDICEHVRVAKLGDGRLGVEEDPTWVSSIMFAALGKHERVLGALHQGRAGDTWGSVWAVAGIVPMLLASPALYIIMGDAVSSTCDKGTALSERSRCFVPI
jgi:hypothetical protein